MVELSITTVVEGVNMAHEDIIQALGGPVKSTESGPISHSANGATVVSDPLKYAISAFEKELERLSRTSEGERNDQLNIASYNLGQLVKAGKLDQNVVEDALLQVATHIGLEERESRKTIESGMSKAMARAIQQAAEAPEATVLDLDPPGVLEDLYRPLDWHRLYEDTDTEVQWLIQDVFERGRLHALYAPSKSGKSLFVQYLVGKAVKAGQLKVLYVDLENSQKDIRVRFSDMGFKPEDLSNLIYFSFPPLPALDSITGGMHLVQLAEAHKVDFVVIDTTSRVIKGPEDEADTFRALYRYAMMPLKAQGIAVVRIDHAGKDIRQGQRGSSAKGDDVDTVWFLQRGDLGRFTLKCDRQRTGNHPEQLTFYLREDPLRFDQPDDVFSVDDDTESNDPTMVINQLLDALDAPNNISGNRAYELLQEKGMGKRRVNVQEAVKARRLRATQNQDELDISGGSGVGNRLDQHERPQ